jgi:hypothetical protein
MTRKRRVFIAHSFREEDQQVIQIFRELLEEDGFECVSLEDPGSESILDRIDKAVSTTDFVIGIFTRRHKFTTGRYSSVPYVNSELGFAIGKQKEVIAFYEEGVDIDETGLTRLQVTLEKFNRITLPTKQAKGRIRQLFDKFKGPSLVVRSDYENIKVRKIVYILETGRGIITTRHWLKIINAESFLGHQIKHTFYPTNIWSNQQKLPDMSSLIEGGIHLGTTAPFFTLRIIDAKFGTSDIKILPLLPESDNSPKAREFSIVFPSTIQDNDQIVYEWAWGIDDLFCVKSEHLALAKSEYESSHFNIEKGPIKLLEYIMNFHQHLLFAKLPEIHVTGPLGYDLLYPVTVGFTRDVLWNRNSVTLDCSQLNQGKVEFRWIPK